jgi:hypothetical protein
MPWSIKINSSVLIALYNRIEVMVGAWLYAYACACTYNIGAPKIIWYSGIIYLPLFYNNKRQFNMKTNFRPIYEIAREIRSDWKNVYYGAVPYLDAMRSITNITDAYYADSAKSVVLYFLANANTWKGEVARRIKKELNDMCKYR